MRRDFVANVSHELRTPLTALLGFIETLRHAARDDPAARDRFLAIMEREAGRMTRIVDDLLSLSRVEANERVRPRNQVVMSDIVLGTMADMAPMIKASECEVNFEDRSNESTIPADAEQLRQVVGNLLENALKYGATGKTIDVTLERLNESVGAIAEGIRLSVRDYGEGIPPHHIPRLTERFYRVDSHRSREIGGTGLGLAIVKHIVNRHRGRIRIESTFGEGTEVIIILPSS